MAAAAAHACEVAAAADKLPTKYGVVLFYAYRAVADPSALLEWHREALGADCLGILGRVRVAAEGINGTLAAPMTNAHTDDALASSNLHTYVHLAVSKFPEVFRDVDWKTSVVDGGAPPFPDLKLELRDEICSSGLKDTNADFVRDFGGVHLSPKEFHDALVHAARPAGHGTKGSKRVRQTLDERVLPPPVPPLDVRELDSSNTVVVDVRNHYEVAAGKFDHPALVDPSTRTYDEFPRWLRDNKTTLADKTVLMYCTGGIRCEKASSLARQLGLPRVFQLRGGIHRYLESDVGANAESSLFVGENYVFDSRRASTVARKCEMCNRMSETASHGTNEPFYGDVSIAPGPEGTEVLLNAGCRVCCVCRDRVLCCDTCFHVSEQRDLYCIRHMHLKGIYHTRLSRFSVDELERQSLRLREEHEKMLKSKASRGKRRTVMKQIRRVDDAKEAVRTSSPQQLQ